MFPLQSFPFYIGNEKGLNQLTIYDETVSRKHAVIDRGAIPGMYLLKDLQSTNGTWVNHIRAEGDAVELRRGMWCNSRYMRTDLRYQRILCQ